MIGPAKYTDGATLAKLAQIAAQCHAIADTDWPTVPDWLDLEQVPDVEKVL